MADRDFMLKVLSSYTVHEMTEEDLKITSVRIAAFWAEFLNMRLHDCETGVLTTRSPYSVK
jgi:hypothetical protein